MANVDFDLKDTRTAALFGLSSDGERVQLGSEAKLISGVDSLVMCRESGTMSELLEGLIEQTLAHFAQDLPGSHVLRDAGFRAYSNPESLPADVEWARFKYGKARAIVLRYESVLYLYSMSSAAKQNELGRNDFSELFYRILEAARPRDIVVATFSRLVRSLSHSPRLQDVIQRHCSRVRTMQETIDIKSAHGQIMWQLFAMLAAGERDAIVQRLFHGKLMMWKRGHWPPGRGRGVPLGYRLTDGILEVDPGQRQILTDVLEVLADETLSDADAAYRIRNMGLKAIRAEAAGLSPSEAREEAKTPQMLIARLMRWMDVYLSGVYGARTTIPFDGLQEFQGLTVQVVQDEDGNPRPVIDLPYAVGKPDVDPELIARARAVRTPRQGDALPPASPLISRTWTDGESTYSMQSWHANRYSILWRSGAPTDGPRSTPSTMNGRVIATVDLDEIHTSILGSIATGLESGVLAERLEMPSRVASLTGTTRVDRIAARIEVFQAECDRLSREIEGALRAASRSEDQENVDRLLERASELRREVAKVKSDISKLQAERQLPPPPLETFETDADLILSALSMLTCPDGVVSPQARVALSHVLTDFQLSLRETEVDWQAFLMLPHKDYEVRLGPFQGTVLRRGRILPEALANDPTVDVGFGQRIGELEVRLRAQGFPKPAAKCAARAPQSLLPRALLGETVEWPGCEEDFDHGEFNEYLRKCWKKPAWSGMQYVRTHPPRQLLTDIVANAGGRIDLESALELGRSHELVRKQVLYITRGPNWPNDVTREWVPPVLREGTWGCTTTAKEHFLLSRLCWSCGEPATAVVRVLEVPGDLMCRSCNAAVDLPGQTFPPLYVAMALPQAYP